MTGAVDAAKCGGASCGHDLPILHIGQDVLHIAVGCLEDAAPVSGFPPFGGSKKESLENRIAVLTSPPAKFSSEDDSTDRGRGVPSAES